MGFQADFDINTLGIISGKLPNRVRALVVEWAASYQDELRENWRRAREGLPLRKIPPWFERINKMKLINVSSVEVLSDYKVRLRFANGVEKVRELKIYLHGPIFQPMRNSYEAFQAVDEDSGTIAWPNGADMDANVLYYDHLKPAWMVEEEMMLKAA